MDHATSAAYLTGVEDLPAHVVEQACKDIGHAAREAYEPSWPELGTIRARCSAILRVERERQESKRLLSSGVPDPLSPEKKAEILAKFRAVLERRSMPRVDQ